MKKKLSFIEICFFSYLAFVLTISGGAYVVETFQHNECPQGYTCEKIPEINCYKHVLVEEIKGNIATKTNVTYLMNGDVRKGFVWSSNYPVENIIFTFENGTRVPRCDEVVG